MVAADLKRLKTCSACCRKKRTTSTAVKNRYNKKTYTQISVSVKKDIAERYKAKCKADGITISEPLHKAINAYIGEDCVEEDSEE